MNLFHWLAGADSDILDQCSKSEKTKIAGFGTMVIIPAVLGLFSMSYAVSTVTENPLIYAFAGVLWFFIVLFIDRFIISTLYKSRVKKTRQFVVSMLTRYVFAIFIGIAVSHPLVLLWFDGSIEEEIAKVEREEISDAREEAQKEIDEVQKRLKEKEDKRDCLRKLLTAEQSGRKENLPCGYSSGIAYCGSRCEQIRIQINELSEEIATLKKDIDKQVTTIEKDREEEVKSLKDNKSDDYLKRVNVLEIIEKKHPHVTWVKWFMILFFVFIDILPITMKIATPRSEYEEIRDTQIFKVEKKQEAERDVLEVASSTSYKKTSIARFNHQQKLEELSKLTEATNDFITGQEKQRKGFDKNVKDILNVIKNTKEPELRKDYLNYLINIRGVFNSAISKAMQKFNDYLNSL